MTIGPIQICIVGFKQTKFRGEILAELNRLSDNDFIRIIDVLGVVKTEDGDIHAIGETDVPAGETVEVGAVIGALLGLQEESKANDAAQRAVARTNGHPVFDDSQVFNLADELLTGEAAAIAVIEHRWMARVQDAVERLNGTFLLDTYVNSDDLIGLGSQVARALEAGANAV